MIHQILVNTNKLYCKLYTDMEIFIKKKKCLNYKNIFVLGVSETSMHTSCVETVCLLLTLSFIDNAYSNGKIVVSIFVIC